MNDNVHEMAEGIRERARTLKSGDGDGTFDEMEQRVRQLETDISFIKGKLDDMPTKDWMTTRLFWVVGSLVLISGLIQFVLDVLGKATH